MDLSAKRGASSMAKVGGLLKLDAICAKLKNNLETRHEIEPYNNKDHHSNGQEHDEPNNNTEVTDFAQVKQILDESQEQQMSPIKPSQEEESEEEEEEDEEDEQESSPSSSVPEIKQTSPLPKETQRSSFQDASMLGDMTMPVDSTLEPNNSQSRKSRRKAQRPRSIAHFSVEQTKDELVEYELNNPEVDFDSICEAAMEEEEEEEEEEETFLEDGENGYIQENGEGILEKVRDFEEGSNSRGEPVDMCSDRSTPDQPLVIDDDDAYEALDLTTGHPSRLEDAEDTEDEEDDEDEEELAEENGVLNLSTSPRKEFRTPTKKRKLNKSANDEVEMKDYAENTMNELLNMYGLGEEDEHTISSKVPLKHFSPGTILNRSPVIAPGTLLQSMKAGVQDLTRQRLQIQRTDPVQMGSDLTRDEDSEDSLSPGPPGLGDKLSTAYIKECFDSQLASPGTGNVCVSPGGQILLPDYYKYLKRYNSYEECGGNHCEDMGYKEHFHCLDCSFRVFVKKEKSTDCFKWHKKREESLQHGFMRYSPMDDCGKKFGSCPHNGKQTHYHCIQMGCSKVYISTSDVQMHANYHRKDSAILQEGFQRFRATEDCGTVSCAFHNQRTTHFHCRRPGCSFTFKNKADMEKHKTYHQKDEILAKDGFKKFMKYEHCNYAGCRYSKASNHIHCIRPGCHYVLHSTGQLYSHKRKHERRDFENAYKRFKDEQQTKIPIMPLPDQLGIGGANPAVSLISNPAGVLVRGPGSNLIGSPAVASLTNKDHKMEELIKMRMSFPHPGGFDDFSDNSSDDELASPDISLPNTPGQNTPLMSLKGEEALSSEHKALPSTLAKLASKINGSGGLSDSLNLTIPGIKQELLTDVQTPRNVSDQMIQDSKLEVRAPSPQTAVCETGFVPKVSPPVNEKKERDESWKKYLTRYTANDPCHSRCQFLYKDHYHCNTVNCGMLFRSKDGVREHAKFHDQQDRITSLTFMSYEANVACPEKCQHSGKEHFHCLWADCKHVIAAADPVFSRMEHYKIHEYSRAAAGRRMPPTPARPIMDTFKRKRGRPPKYPKNEIPLVPKIEMGEEEIAVQARHSGPQHCITSGFKKFSPIEPCPDDKCMYFMKEHYHCLRPRCHHATDRFDVLNLHAKDFHSYINILDGFEFFDRTVNCRRPHCHNNRANRHFHCVRPRCDYSFVRVSTMAQHDKKHRMVEMGLNPSALSASKIMIRPKTATGGTNQPISIAPMPKGIVRAAGTFFPVPTLANSRVFSTGVVQVSSNPPVMVTVPARAPVPTTATKVSPPIILTPVKTTPTAQLITIAPKPAQQTPPPSIILQSPAPNGAPSIASATPANNALPLTMLLQKKAAKLMPQTSWVTLLLKMHYSAKQNCGRPFCKLKKKDHYHCFDCNQAFSDPSRLKVHVTKHGFHVDKSDFVQGRVMPLSSSNDTTSRNNAQPDVVLDLGSEVEESEDVGSSLNLTPGAFSNLLQKGLDQVTVSAPQTPSTVIDLSMPQKSQADVPKQSNKEDSSTKQPKKKKVPTATLR